MDANTETIRKPAHDIAEEFIDDIVPELDPDMQSAELDDIKLEPKRRVKGLLLFLICSAIGIAVFFCSITKGDGSSETLFSFLYNGFLDLFGNAVYWVLTVLIGGNLCLDTRCTYYNQSYFWREALGFCLKLGGDTCHVTRTGKKCVAAHSADTVPALITLGAQVDVVSADGTRTLGVDPFFVADGKWNMARHRDELVARVRIPLPGQNVRTGYTKVRQRNSIDFPLLSIAAAAEVDGDDAVQRISLVVSALGSRPRVVTGLDKVAVGQRLGDVAEAVAQLAFKQCHPLENLIVDPDWRRAMVPVYVRRTLLGMTSVRELAA